MQYFNQYNANYINIENLLQIQVNDVVKRRFEYENKNKLPIEYYAKKIDGVSQFAYLTPINLFLPFTNEQFNLNHNLRLSNYYICFVELVRNEQIVLIDCLAMVQKNFT